MLAASLHCPSLVHAGLHAPALHMFSHAHADPILHPSMDIADHSCHMKRNAAAL